MKRIGQILALIFVILPFANGVWAFVTERDHTGSILGLTALGLFFLASVVLKRTGKEERMRSLLATRLIRFSMAFCGVVGLAMVVGGARFGFRKIAVLGVIISLSIVFFGCLIGWLEREQSKSNQ